MANNGGGDDGMANGGVGDGGVGHGGVANNGGANNGGGYDINRWLRAVRPGTDADAADWAATPGAQQMFAEIRARVAAPKSPRGGSINSPSGVAAATSRGWRAVRRPRVWLPAGGAFAAAAAAAVLIASTAGTGPGSGSGLVPGSGGGSSGAIAVAPQLPAIRPAAMLLSSYASCPDLLAGLRAHAAANVQPYGFPGQQSSSRFAPSSSMGAASDGVVAAAAEAAAGDNGGQTSRTNVQEAGVDEPDIVKTDGGRVLTITGGTLRVLDAASHTVTGSLDLTLYQGWQNAQLLVQGAHALVILAGTDNAPLGFQRSLPPGYQVPAVPSSMSTYLFVDLSGQPKVTGSLRASGSYLDARLIGSTVRLVVHSSPKITLPPYAGDNATRTAANKAAIAQAPLTAWLPQYSISTASQSTTQTVPCGAISHAADYTATSMLTVYTLDLAQLGSTPTPVSVAADGDTVYATGSSLYIASNPSWYSAPVGSQGQQTQIHRFDITGAGQPRYLGSGSVSGRLLSQYSLSEFHGSLRIATTFGSESMQDGRVYVLNADTLAVTGQVDGLGNGEQIYAVRFVRAVAYVVTFKRTDPLYVLDLRNPNAPMVAGILQLTGYSDYLHDAGDGRIIGVGQEASSAGQIAGLQVSLFDVSTLAKPTRIGHTVLPGAPGEANLDPHAFLYWQPTGLVVVPVQSWTAAESGKVLVLRVSGSSLISLGTLANPRGTNSTDDGLGIERSLIVNGSLWTLSASGVQVSAESNLARQAWVPFS